MTAVVKHGQAGQTLLEMLIAIALVALVLVGLVAGSVVGLRTTRLARERNVASQLAIAEIENARRERDVDPEAFFASAGVTGPTTVGSNPAYRVTVTKVLNGNQMQVTVVVAWDDAAGTYDVSQETYLTRWL